MYHEIIFGNDINYFFSNHKTLGEQSLRTIFVKNICLSTKLNHIHLSYLKPYDYTKRKTKTKSLKVFYVHHEKSWIFVVIIHLSSFLPPLTAVSSRKQRQSHCWFPLNLSHLHFYCGFIHFNKLVALEWILSSEQFPFAV